MSEEEVRYIATQIARLEIVKAFGLDPAAYQGYISAPESAAYAIAPLWLLPPTVSV